MNPRPSPFRNGFNSRELRDLFQQGLIHIVAPAVYGKSNFPVALSLCDRANPAHMAAWSRGREVSDQSNAEGRCVSLLPDLPLTAMPTHRTWSDAEGGPLIPFLGNNVTLQFRSVRLRHAWTQTQAGAARSGSRD